MGRARDIASLLTTSSVLATDSEVAALGYLTSASANSTYRTIDSTGLAKIIPSSVAVGSGSGSIDSLGNVTFSGASSVSLNGIFNSTYTNYRLIFSNFSHSASGNTYWRMRASGTDASGANYMGNWWSFANTATNRFWSTSTSAPELFDNYANYAIIDIFEPNNAAFTSVYSTASNYGSGNNAAFNPGAGTHGLANAYDGITFTRSAGNFGSTIQIYGYIK